MFIKIITTIIIIFMFHIVSWSTKAVRGGDTCCASSSSCDSGAMCVSVWVGGGGKQASKHNKEYHQLIGHAGGV